MQMALYTDSSSKIQEIQVCAFPEIVHAKHMLKNPGVCWWLA